MTGKKMKDTTKGTMSRSVDQGRRTIKDIHFGVMAKTDYILTISCLSQRVHIGADQPRKGLYIEQRNFLFTLCFIIYFSVPA